MSFTESVELFPGEISLAIQGLNNENRRKILYQLYNSDKLSFSELGRLTSIEPSLLAIHLKKLRKMLLVVQIYEFESKEKTYSYYEITNFCKRIIDALNFSRALSKILGVTNRPRYADEVLSIIS